jgi:hypothetical protein
MFAGRILAGGLLLVLGRKLFWLYVAILGFVTGLTVASRLFNVQPEWLQLVIAIGFGILGAVLAYFFQEIAVAVAGFLVGAYVALTLVANFAGNAVQNGDTLNWVLFFAGGIIGAVLAVMLFDWALIILTSLAGALLVTEGLAITGTVGWLVAAGLFILGIIIQANLEQPPRHHTHTTTTTSA